MTPIFRVIPRLTKKAAKEIWKSIQKEQPEIIPKILRECRYQQLSPIVLTQEFGDPREWPDA